VDTDETLNPDQNVACAKNRGLTAAVAQMELQGFGDTMATGAMIERNAERTARTVEKLIAAAGVIPQVIVLPVLCLTGIGAVLQERGIAPRIDREAIAINLLANDPRLEPLQKLCATYKCFLASSCVEKISAFPGRYFHTGFALGPSGIVLRSPKTQAPTSAGITLLKDFHKEYIDFFGSDAILPVAEMPFGKVGCLVETEFLIPEATRTLRRKGAEIILHPTAQHAGPGYPPYQALRQSLAYTNGVYWLSAVPSRETAVVHGKQQQTWFGGGSSIIGPDGSVIACITGRHQGLVTGNIDLDFLKACREKQRRYTEPDPGIYEKR
jgi:predicted amidohydrolase